MKQTIQKNEVKQDKSELPKNIGNDQLKNAESSGYNELEERLKRLELLRSKID